MIKINEVMRAESNQERYELYNKLYLGEIVEREKTTFESNSLILAPVGSGKSNLIENKLIPKGFSGNILYLTSNTALKDSVCPDDNILRKELADKGKSVKFFTTKNKKRYGDKPYNVHVMTYHEFGGAIQSPAEKLTGNIDIIFCDEIHSLPRYKEYGGSSDTLILAMNWLFRKHDGKQIYYFTATKKSLADLEARIPGYLHYVNTYDYLEHPDIRKYVANSIVFIKHIEQVRDHLKSKLKAFNYYGYKGLAFTRLISEQERIKEIAIEEGFKPIVLWSVNNTSKMNEEQLKVRKYILNTGNIPEPYNLLIINGSMQEGWNLDDNMMRLAILDTLDQTEQIQALGRIRRDIDLLICKTEKRLESYNNLEVPDKYLNTPLTSEDKTSLYIRLNVINDKGEVSKWPTVKGLLEKLGYEFEEKIKEINKKKTRVTIITKPEFK